MDPTDRKRVAARASILRRCRRIIAEYEQGLRDALHYNRHHLPEGETPIDVEPFRVGLHVART